MAKDKKKSKKQIISFAHVAAKRSNIPTAEHQSIAQDLEDVNPFAPVKHPRRYPLGEGEHHPRDGDIDPQLIWGEAHVHLKPGQIEKLAEEKKGGYLKLDTAQIVWHGKDEKDRDDLVIPTPPLYIQEKIHPEALMNDLRRISDARSDADEGAPDLFADFNGVDAADATDFYHHEQNWSNRMILGDSLQAMASLSEREGLVGKVQCVYFDPPYGIKFNSNWQVDARSRNVQDGKDESKAREPEVIKAFRDTWDDKIHSYLGYIRDRLVAMRELLTESGSIFVQISDENVHRVRMVMDEVFGDKNFVSMIYYATTSGLEGKTLGRVGDYILYYAKDKDQVKYRPLYLEKDNLKTGDKTYRSFELPNGERHNMTAKQRRGEEPIPQESHILAFDNLTSGGTGSGQFPIEFEGNTFTINKGNWKTNKKGIETLRYANRLGTTGKTIHYIRYADDFPVKSLKNMWTDTGMSFAADKRYVVQTGPKVIQRCILMATDPGDLVLDPTCGSGTTAYVAEQWGRRWITMDTSRVALALARARIMSARYPFYLLADTPEGRKEEQKISGKPQSDSPTLGDIRQGFVYERARHITLGDIANNTEIDVIWNDYQSKMQAAKDQLNTLLNESWNDWEIPHDADTGWPAPAREAHAEWWQLRLDRQATIDASIAKNAGTEMLYDQPCEDKKKVRVAGPFTVEALTPHRALPAEEDNFDAAPSPLAKSDFIRAVLENLQTAGVQQGAKEDRITLEGVEGWPGSYIAAKARTTADGKTMRVGIFIGPEYGAVSRVDLTTAAREATEAGFDMLIACGFNFDVHTSEVDKMGRLHIIKAKMNPDLHMANDLKNTGAGNMFVVFGEPDISPPQYDKDGNITISVNGVDVFDPKQGLVRSDGREGIAAWFIDTDYNEESFFVRHAYFLGANDQYKALKTTLKAEIDEEAWQTINSATSRPFPPPKLGQFAVKVINHYGDEVMKVFKVTKE